MRSVFLALLSLGLVTTVTDLWAMTLTPVDTVQSALLQVEPVPMPEAAV